MSLEVANPNNLPKIPMKYIVVSDYVDSGFTKHDTYEAAVKEFETRKLEEGTKGVDWYIAAVIDIYDSNKG